MRQIQATSRRLADSTGDRVVALWALFRAGELSREEFRRFSSAAIALANVQGVVLADLGLTAEVSRQLGRRAAPLGLRPTAVQVDRARIRASLDRIVDEDGSDLQFHRLGRSEPLLTVASSVQEGMKRRDVGGWTRVLTGGSCQLCEGWADGAVRPVTVHMARHVGCDCIQMPVF